MTQNQSSNTPYGYGTQNADSIPNVTRKVQHTAEGNDPFDQLISAGDDLIHDAALDYGEGEINPNNYDAINAAHDVARVPHTLWQSHKYEQDYIRPRTQNNALSQSWIRNIGGINRYRYEGEADNMLRARAEMDFRHDYEGTLSRHKEIPSMQTKDLMTQYADQLHNLRSNPNSHTNEMMSNLRMMHHELARRGINMDVFDHEETATREGLQPRMDEELAQHRKRYHLFHENADKMHARTRRFYPLWADQEGIEPQEADEGELGAPRGYDMREGVPPIPEGAPQGYDMPPALEGEAPPEGVLPAPPYPRMPDDYNRGIYPRYETDAGAARHEEPMPHIPGVVMNADGTLPMQYMGPIRPPAVHPAGPDLRGVGPLPPILGPQPAGYPGPRRRADVIARRELDARNAPVPEGLNPKQQRAYRLMLADGHDEATARDLITRIFDPTAVDRYLRREDSPDGRHRFPDDAAPVAPAASGEPAEPSAPPSTADVIREGEARIARETADRRRRRDERQAELDAYLAEQRRQREDVERRYPVPFAQKVKGWWQGLWAPSDEQRAQDMFIRNGEPIPRHIVGYSGIPDREYDPETRQWRDAGTDALRDFTRRQRAQIAAEIERRASGEPEPAPPPGPAPLEEFRRRQREWGFIPRAERAAHAAEEAAVRPSDPDSISSFNAEMARGAFAAPPPAPAPDASDAPEEEEEPPSMPPPSAPPPPSADEPPVDLDEEGDDSEPVDLDNVDLSAVAPEPRASIEAHAMLSRSQTRAPNPDEIIPVRQSMNADGTLRSGSDYLRQRDLTRVRHPHFLEQPIEGENTARPIRDVELRGIIDDDGELRLRDPARMPMQSLLDIHEAIHNEMARFFSHAFRGDVLPGPFPEFEAFHPNLNRANIAQLNALNMQVTDELQARFPDAHDGIGRIIGGTSAGSSRISKGGYGYGQVEPMRLGESAGLPRDERNRAQMLRAARAGAAIGGVPPGLAAAEPEPREAAPAPRGLAAMFRTWTGRDRR
jgi:hypothetical protein